MRSIFGILGIILLIVPFYGTYNVLKHERYLIRKQVKRHLMHHVDKSELVHLSFTQESAEKELRWEHSKEFEYNGEMFDVVERTITDDSLHFWCWWDHEETELNQRLVSLLENSMHQSPFQQKNVELMLAFGQHLFKDEIEDLQLSYSEKCAGLMNWNYPFQISDGYQSEISPPPESAV